MIFASDKLNTTFFDTYKTINLQLQTFSRVPIIITLKVNFFLFRLQEVILKRAADLAEALYTMPRNNQLSLSLPRSPCSRDRDGNNMSSATGPAGTGFNPYTGQLAVTVHDHGAASQWNDGE